MIVYITDHALAANLKVHTDAGHDRTADAALHAQHLTKRGLWECACAWDRVNVDEMFVVFSDSNPYARAYDRAVYIDPTDVFLNAT